MKILLLVALVSSGISFTQTAKAQDDICTRDGTCPEKDTAEKPAEGNSDKDPKPVEVIQSNG